MANPPTREFGKRRPVIAQVAQNPAPPVKRSGHVALLLMGTVALGGGAYALMPRNSCEPASPGMAAPSSPQTATNCSARGYSSSSGSGGSGSSWSRRSSFFGGDSVSSSSSGTASGSGGVTRGGFGSFAHAFASHFGG
jgi:hypothetical protein